MGARSTNEGGMLILAHHGGSLKQLTSQSLGGLSATPTIASDCSAGEVQAHTQQCIAFRLRLHAHSCTCNQVRVPGTRTVGASGRI